MGEVKEARPQIFPLFRLVGGIVSVEKPVMESRITVDPAMCHGKPCIRGLRYPVENILEWLAA